MEVLTENPPTLINPYEVLEIETTATAGDIKSAYKKLALRHHPDKAQPNARDAAHVKFQEVAFAYAILSDDRRRKRYDTTGNTQESLDLDDDDFNWSDFFRAQWADAITGKTIDNFKGNYQHSEEERRDVLAAYGSSGGEMDAVFGQVMLSNAIDDEDRFRDYIGAAIEAGEVESFDTYVNEPARKREKRQKDAGREGKEAKEHAKKIGVYDQLFDDENIESGRKDNQKGKHDGLAALIQQRQKSRASNFLDNLEAKYVGEISNGAKGRKGRKRKLEEEPPEEMFQKNRQRKGKVSKVEEADDEEHDLEAESATDTDQEEEVKPRKPRAKKEKAGKRRKKASA